MSDITYDELSKKLERLQVEFRNLTCQLAQRKALVEDMKAATGSPDWATPELAVFILRDRERRANASLQQLVKQAGSASAALDAANADLSRANTRNIKLKSESDHFRAQLEMCKMACQRQEEYEKKLKAERDAAMEDLRGLREELKVAASQLGRERDLVGLCQGILDGILKEWEASRSLAQTVMPQRLAELLDKTREKLRGADWTKLLPEKLEPKAKPQSRARKGRKR